ncbi:MAG: squalene/phytoene synthase family protein, partial [Verrucomicrobiales bacterium]|nr:squalene/phytoene synthase family protein [Verrucomicrobiales bacterium]
MPGAPRSSQENTRKAQSNLAFALLSLPRQRRRDMVTYYAFCRVVDDIADDTALPLSQRRNRLRQWRDYVSDPASHQPCPDPLLDEVLALAPRYGFETGLLLELI